MRFFTATQTQRDIWSASAELRKWEGIAAFATQPAVRSWARAKAQPLKRRLAELEAQLEAEKQEVAP